MWTTFHGSENRSGVSTVAGPTNDQVAWTACVSGQHLRLGPVSDGRRIFVGGDLGTIYALNNSVEGPKLWNVTLSAPPTQMELTGGTLIVATTFGALYALDADTGTIQWRLELGARLGQGPAVDAGSVFVATETGALQAYSVSTGSPIWQLALAGPVVAAPAVEAGVLYVVTFSGTVEAVSESGTHLWSAAVNGNVTTAAAVTGGRVLVADEGGHITALAASNGSRLWQWTSPDRLPDPIDATPAVGGTAAYLETDNGETGALNLSNGTLAWFTSGEYSPYPSISAPILAPNGLYVMVNGLDSLVDFNTSTGREVWGSDILTGAFSSPALLNGQVLLGTDLGCLFDFGPGGPPHLWSVAGVVADTNGTPLAGALVTAGTYTTLTSPNGSFSFLLSNGSWPLTVSFSGFYPASQTVSVNGPTAPLFIALRPLTFFPIDGTVEGGYTGAPIANVTVRLVAPYGFTETAVTDAAGAFQVRAPNGTSSLTTDPTQRYGSATTIVQVDGGPVLSVVLRALPPDGSFARSNPLGAELWLPLAALGISFAVVLAWSLSRRRVAIGLPPELLSPFGQYVVQRLLLIPAQIVGVLAVIYFVGNVIGGGTGCPPGQVLCVTSSYAGGLGEFLRLLFTGQWGWVTYGNLREPVTVLLQWWVPNSIELALFALPISAAIAYPIGLLSGWRPGSVLDETARLSSMTVLMVPSIVVVFLLFAAIDRPFYVAFGDLPDGLVPSGAWLAGHGGFPSWWVFGGTTVPTHFPLVDGILHGDGPFVGLLLAKILLQAVAIAIVYVTVFLRHARNATAELVRELHLTAARSRGVPESTLLWRHTRRRVLPVYLLIFSLTIPTYLGTQAVVEVLFSDTGFGTLLFYEVTSIGSHPIGFSGPLSGNFYQVALLLLLLVVLLGTLVTDVVSRYLDPRTRSAR